MYERDGGSNHASFRYFSRSFGRSGNELRLIGPHLYSQTDKGLDMYSRYWPILVLIKQPMHTSVDIRVTCRDLANPAQVTAGHKRDRWDYFLQSTQVVIAFPIVPSVSRLQGHVYQPQQGS